MGTSRLSGKLASSASSNELRNRNREFQIVDSKMTEKILRVKVRDGEPLLYFLPAIVLFDGIMNSLTKTDL